MTALIMITVFVVWLLYSFVFSSGASSPQTTNLHYDIPDFDDDIAPLNPTAARDIAGVLARAQIEVGEAISERS